MQFAQQQTMFELARQWDQGSGSGIRRAINRTTRQTSLAPKVTTSFSDASQKLADALAKFASAYETSLSGLLGIQEAIKVVDEGTIRLAKAISFFKPKN